MQHSDTEGVARPSQATTLVAPRRDSRRSGSTGDAVCGVLRLTDGTYRRSLGTRDPNPRAILPRHAYGPRADVLVSMARP
jgi:hypothetical protein